MEAELFNWKIEGDYSYSSTQVNLKDPLSQEIMDWGQENIPDEDLYTDDDNMGREDTPHITVLYGIVTQEADEVIEVLADEGPVKITLGKISLFENDDNYDVVKIDIESEDLARLNKLLADNLENENDFPEYKPHITIAYVEQGSGKLYSGSSEFEGREVSFDQIRFSTKDEESTFIDLTGIVAANLNWRV